MSQAQTVTMRVFRTMDPLSGNLRVVAGSRRRRGVRKPNGQAMSKSQEIQAGSDDESGMTAGRGATSASAPAADRESGADAAREKAKETARTPHIRKEDHKDEDIQSKVETDKNDCPEGGGGTGDDSTSLWDKRNELGKGGKLPEDGWSFLKAVNGRYDIVGAVVLHLKSVDEKLGGRLVEQLLEMAYEKNVRVAEEESPARISCNVPGQ